MGFGVFDMVGDPVGVASRANTREVWSLAAALPVERMAVAASTTGVELHSIGTCGCYGGGLSASRRCSAAVGTWLATKNKERETEKGRDGVENSVLGEKHGHAFP